MKRLLALAAFLCFSFSTATAQNSGDGSVVLALDNSWNRALESNDTKALDLLLADKFVSPRPISRRDGDSAHALGALGAQMG